MQWEEIAMDDDKLIGILAGMGPRSTAPFIDLVIDECQAQYGAKYDEEFPKMMIYSLPAPFYIDRPINHELMKKTIIAGLRKLESIGAHFIAMPCNSAHVYFSELQASINVPLLNIIEETVGMLPSVPQKTTLFSTVQTFESGLYQKGITDGGHEFVFKSQWRSYLDELIKGIKADKGNPLNIGLWDRLIEAVRKESVENIVIACTDLNAVSGVVHPQINIVDSSKCLAKAVVTRYISAR